MKWMWREPHPKAWVLLLVAAAAAVPGCGKDRSRDLLPTPLRFKDLDTLEPGEVAAGTESAYGLPIPREMRVTARMPGAVYAVGMLGFEQLQEYVAAQVTAERIDKGRARVVYDNATLNHAPNKKVRVEIAKLEGKMELVVRDRSPRPAERGLTEAQRWKRAGLTPGGKVLENQGDE